MKYQIFPTSGPKGLRPYEEKLYAKEIMAGFTERTKPMSDILADLEFFLGDVRKDIRLVSSLESAGKREELDSLLKRAIEEIKHGRATKESSNGLA